MGIQTSGQRQHFKNVLNIVINWGLFFKPFLENSGPCLFISWRLFLFVLLIRIATELVDATTFSRKVDLHLRSLRQNKKKATSFRSLQVVTSSPWSLFRDDHWSFCADSCLCCVYSVNRNNHSAFRWSRFCAVVLAKFSSQCYSSLQVNQGDLDFGSV